MFFVSSVSCCLDLPTLISLSQYYLVRFTFRAEPFLTHPNFTVPVSYWHLSNPSLLLIVYFWSVFIYTHTLPTSPLCSQLNRN